MGRSRHGMIFAILVAAVACNPWMLQAKDETSEEQLMLTLESTASLQQKDAACAQLKRVGTVRCVPALGALLKDADLSHSARYALESMPAREAGRALVDALEETTGLVKAGIVHSLYVRREPGVADRMTGLLGESDPAVAAAAATALGAIATGAEADALFDAHAHTKEPAVRRAAGDALLACAYRLLAGGRAEDAARIFAKLLEAPAAGDLKGAALRGTITSAAPDRALDMTTAALVGDDGARRQAALEMARELRTPKATAALCGILPDLTTAPMQAALIEALRQRGDTGAAGTFVAMAGSRDALVRIAAVGALGDLGDSTAVPPLVEALESADETERKAARQALIDVRRGAVTEALIGQMAAGTPQVQRQLGRIVAERGGRSAVPMLLELARKGKPSAREAALQTLGRLAQAQDIPALVQLAADSEDTAACSQAGDALVRACVRLQAEGKPVDVEPIALALSGGGAAARMALLPAASALGDARLRGALREALKASDAHVRQAAVKALCDARDTELLPDLLALAKNAADEKTGIQAVRALLRLATDNGTTPGLSPARRVESLGQIVAVARRDEEKRAVLGALGETTGSLALELAVPLLDHAATRPEAIMAVTKIAETLPAEHAAAARSALRKALAVAGTEDQRNAASAALDKIGSGTSAAAAANAR